MSRTRPTEHGDQVLTPTQVEDEYEFLTKQSLANMRWRRQGPAYIKTSQGRNGRVLYRRSAIEAWLDEHTVKAVADA